jgi:hypothetical protein
MKAKKQLNFYLNEELLKDFKMCLLYDEGYDSMTKWFTEKVQQYVNYRLSED